PKQMQAVVVNETFVKTYWGEGADGVGRKIRYRSDENKNPWITVVGVVHDIKHYGLERPMRPAVYFPISMNPDSALTLAVHTTGDATLQAPAVRDVLRRMDPDVPLFRVRAME